MDLHLIPDALLSDQERSAVDAVLGLPETGWEGPRAWERSWGSCGAWRLGM